MFQTENCLFFFPVSARNLLLHSHSLIVSSIVGRKARALYACKAEHDSELSFIAGTIFENGESGSKLANRKGKTKQNMWAGVFLETNNCCLKQKADPWEIAVLNLALMLDFILRVGNLF